jgi:hypothetical protein
MELSELGVMVNGLSWGWVIESLDDFIRWVIGVYFFARIH